MFIGAVILFIIALVISFSIGVEQGKRIASDKTITVKTKPKTDKKTKKKPSDKRKKKTPTSSSKSNTSKRPTQKTATSTLKQAKGKGKYAVQLVVYKDSKYADKEMKYLSSQKYPFFKEKKNGKIIICAGPFETIQEAKQAASKLRPRYKDCFVKLLKRKKK